ncbi:unnamed protein product [Amoebophrya sp. A25]|nr:unnamed protein product [Amoebophrya sp. A25]|eukprot:GSA25T00009938001.1
MKPSLFIFISSLQHRGLEGSAKIMAQRLIRDATKCSKNGRRS